MIRYASLENSFKESHAVTKKNLCHLHLGYTKINCLPTTNFMDGTIALIYPFEYCTLIILDGCLGSSQILSCACTQSFWYVMF